MNFGLLGPGSIARKFADACSRTEGVKLLAVASGSRERAEAFAAEFKVEKVCGSYEELLALPEIDAVYISVINSLHYETARKCLEAGKAVLCEKPFCVTVSQTEELIRLAEEKGLLLMEGMWTLFLPCVCAVRNWVKEGRIGRLKYLDSSFSFYAPADPESRLFSAPHGGGAAFDVGIYSLAFSLSMTGQQPDSCRSKLYVGETGVDEMGAALLGFPDKTVANCMFGIQGKSEDSAHLYGDAGMIHLPQFWNCHEAKLYNAGEELLETVTDSQENGFVYEIEAFRDAFLRGDREVETVSHQLTLACAKLLEEIRKEDIN